MCSFQLFCVQFALMNNLFIRIDTSMCPTYWRRCEKALKADTAHFGNWRRMFEARLWTRPLPAQKGKAWNCSRSEDWHIHKFFPGILQKYATSILRVSTQQSTTMVDAWCVYVLNMQSLDMAFKGIFCSSYATLVTLDAVYLLPTFPNSCIPNSSVNLA